MKKLLLLISLFAGMSSCYHEDTLEVSEQPDKYGVLKDNPSDPIQHFIYEFYQKYETVIITNPTISDYRFNYNSSNGIAITAPAQNQKVVEQGIEFLQKVLLDLYPDDFLKKNLPFSIILAEEMKMASYGETAILNCYASRNFIAVSNVVDGVGDMSESNFVKIRADVNASFWAIYMSQVRGLFSVPETFYEASLAVESKIYGGYFYLGAVNPATIDFYKYGLVSYNTDASYIDYEDEWFTVYAPTKSQDLAQWMNFVFEKTPAELQEIFNAYPVMKKKYDIIREAMLANGFDLATLEL